VDSLLGCVVVFFFVGKYVFFWTEYYEKLRWGKCVAPGGTVSVGKGFCCVRVSC